MYDKELALDSLANIEDALKMITERASAASTPDDFLISPDGMLRLDSIGGDKNKPITFLYPIPIFK